MTTKKLTLLKPHTDAGRDYQAGDPIEVDEATAKWLVDNEIAAALPGTTGKASTTAPAAG